jgi:hypothetical protein
MVVKDQRKGGSKKPVVKSSDDDALYHTYPSSGTKKK